MPRLESGDVRDPLEEPDRRAYDNFSSREHSVTYTLLSSTLCLAVPLWIDKLRHQGWEYVLQRARDCSQHVAEHGDVILYLSKKKGETAEAFNRLAEGIACLSFAPGGVKVFGSHWESILGEDWPDRASASLLEVCRSMQSLFEKSVDGEK